MPEKTAVIEVPAGDASGAVESRRAEILETVHSMGSVLLRGFDELSVEEFSGVAEILLDDVVRENGEHEPIGASSFVQTPVRFSPERKLLWHNENSFNHRWPLILLFCPVVTATSGGRTPLTDARELLRVLDPAIVELFRERGITYVRRFGNGIGLPWQKVFGTDIRSKLESRAAAEGVAVEWGTGGKLTTWSVRPAMISHPLTGELAWFGQPTHWHPACLEDETREALIDVLGVDDLPRDCRFGDGSVIPDSVMVELVAAHESIESSFDWIVGDVLIVDNVLSAHARDAYEGPRRLLVAMGNEHEFAQHVGTDTRRIAR
ncbi:TauD/TfdA family dioxygenase [Williamsia soli]|uniref:TauD/TfdA family dioxygenase n=1 Tax=Williamsia soli TaxID=364929 RepID=UPI002350FFC6|nr:TauD/TfdA family dioxygenase [Williamsia soli]